MVPAAIGKTDDRHGDDATARVELGVKLGDILFAGGIHQAQLPAVIVEMAAHPDQRARVTETESARGHILARRQVVARAAAVLHVEPRGVDVLQPSAAWDQGLVFNPDFEVRVRMARFGLIVEHRGDEDALTLMHAVAETRRRWPVVHLAARAEDVLGFCGAEEIGAAGVIERDVMQQPVGESAAGAIGQSRMVSGDPALERNRQGKTGRLLDSHSRVSGQVKRPKPHGQDVRRGVVLRIEFCGRRPAHHVRVVLALGWRDEHGYRDQRHEQAENPPRLRVSKSRA